MTNSKSNQIFTCDFTSSLSHIGFGAFMKNGCEALGAGTRELDSGEKVFGFLCEAYAVEGAEEITHFGGWHAYLLLFATTLFIFGKSLTAKFLSSQKMIPPFPMLGIFALKFLISVYGGYFGGGMGIITLAVLALIGLEAIQDALLFRRFPRA